MDDSILAMFVEDAREHLADIEQDLLDIEDAGAGFDPELVNKVFRTAHSIKGSAAFLGLTPMRDLSHGIENVLDQVRSHALAPSHQVVNTVLAAFDSLNLMLDDVEHCDAVDIAPQLQALTRLVEHSLPPEQRPAVTTMCTLRLPDGREAFTLSLHALTQARRGGNYVYLVEYDLIHHVHRQGKSPLELLRFLEKSGQILDCRVDFDAVGTLEDTFSNRIPFYVLYASILESDLARAIFQLPQELIHVIDRETNQTCATAAPPRNTADSGLAGPAPVEPEEVEAMAAEFDRALQRIPQQAGMDELPEGVTMDLSATVCRLRIAGRATVERASDLRQALLMALDQHPTLELDCADVEEVDITFLQLLWAAWLSAKARQTTVSCTAMSPALTRALRLAGFHRVAFDSYGLNGFPSARS